MASPSAIRYWIEVNKAKEGRERVRLLNSEDNILASRWHQERSALRQSNYQAESQGRDVVALGHSGSSPSKSSMLVASSAQEHALAREMIIAKYKEIVDEIDSLCLIETSPELRALKSKMCNIEAAQAQLVQVAEKKVVGALDLECDKAQQDTVERMWNANPEVSLKLQCERKAAMTDLRAGLQDQIHEKQNDGLKKYIDFLLQKRVLDETTRSIHEADQDMWDRKMALMERTGREIDEFRAARRVWKQRELEATTAENVRIMRYVIDKDMAEAHRLEVSQMSSSSESPKNLVAKQMEDSLAREQEVNRTLAELMAAEMDERAARHVAEEMEHRMRMRVEMQAILQTQIKDQVERLRLEEANDSIYRHKLMVEMAEQAEFHTQTREKKRQLKLDFNIQANELMAERRLRRAQAREAMQRSDEEIADAYKSRMCIVEEERARVLRECTAEMTSDTAPLPRAVLRKMDSPHLGPDFVAAYGPMKKFSS